MTDYTRLFDIAAFQLKNHPKKDAFCRKENGSWITYSTQDYIEIANKVSHGLLNLGVKPGDKIALISTNRPEWNFVDMGILQIGAINVPVYPTISESEYNYIFNDAEIIYAFVEGEMLYQKIASIKANIPSLKQIFSFEEITSCPSFKEFLKTGENGDNARLEELKSNVKSADLATIIYTSGTTGNPKGVMLSHDNVVSNVKAVNPMLPLSDQNKVLSFLPLCHIFERTVVYVYISRGVSIYYAENMEAIADNLKEVQPHFFSTVPRLLEKVYMKLEAASANLEGFKKDLYIAALAFANNFEVDKNYGLLDSLKYKIYDFAIYSKWRAALGGNVKGIVTGAAKLNPKLARVFTAAGIPISEGYGQTESSPVISLNPIDVDKIKFGTVGVVIEGVEVKMEHREGMAENEGEIICKGPNVMMGYYKQPELTAQTIRNGWLYTGDVGKFIDYKGNKYIQITDRVKEIFKTSGGKYISPLALESKMKEIPFIEQMLVIGENRNFVSALIVPNFLNLKDWCAKNKVDFSNNESIIANKQVKKMFEEAIQEKNKGFGQWETIKKFELLKDEWTVDTGELTPTMKVKRKVVLEKFKDLIEGIYTA